MDLQLGVPDFARSLPPHNSVFDSRVGGVASYFERGGCGAGGGEHPAAAPTPPPPHPTCSLCHTPLFLLLQLYAPAEHERSLLLLGCNAAACKGGPGAWVARRTQGGPVAEAGGEAAAAAPPADAGFAKPSRPGRGARTLLPTA